MDNEIQGSEVGLWFSKSDVVPLCLMKMRNEPAVRHHSTGKYPVLQASN